MTCFQFQNSPATEATLSQDVVQSDSVYDDAEVGASGDRASHGLPALPTAAARRGRLVEIVSKHCQQILSAETVGRNCRQKLSVETVGRICW